MTDPMEMLNEKLVALQQQIEKERSRADQLEWQLEQRAEKPRGIVTDDGRSSKERQGEGFTSTKEGAWYTWPAYLEQGVQINPMLKASKVD